ncbi:hypothetical protein FIBSPDRAFT_929604 [Athelia psychrophila]|uniref:Uncharacterized protein n=1 Tax=Athelia psychrophila TaxID=1759441 RepID=A0A166NJ54_9AGAM|nr:hypothetical protein FIBSPDRAFT_929604 [Fibularhizoctonia sp. CBS 109695]
MSELKSSSVTPIAFAAIAIILGLSTSYVLYIIIAAVTDKIGRNAFLPIYPDDLPSAYGTRRKVFFIGRRRTPEERLAVNARCASFIFQRSIFRKHPFEPTGWAIFRGIIAVYCFIGLLGFAAYTGYSEEQTYGNGILETTIPSDFVRYNPSPFPFLSVAISNSISQPIPSDFALSGYPNMVQNVTASDSQFWTEYFSVNETLSFPFIDNDFNVSWSGDVALDIWATSSNINGSIGSIPVSYSPGFPLVPFMAYDITLTIISYKMNHLSWLFFQPQVRSAVASGSNTTTASFSCSWQTQMQITHRDLISLSTPVMLALALSKIGGVYAFIDGVFALIFGRTMLAILFGSKAISPFGVLGMLTRKRFARSINAEYPHLQADIEHRGMAAYISEVAIDPGIITGLNSASSQVATSSQRSHPGDDAEGAGLITLRYMGPSEEKFE